MAKLVLCLKVVDRFCATLKREGEKDIEYENYVPDFMPGNHYGDYVELDIDTDTGQILNWERPSEKQLVKQLKSE